MPSCGPILRLAALAASLSVPAALGAQTPAPAPQPPQGEAAKMARQFPFVTVDQGRLYRETLYGQALQRSLEEQQKGLAAENREIEALLEQREQALTQQRANRSADEFRVLADAFNAEVERHRAAQDAKERGIYALREASEARFRQALSETLAELLLEHGAMAVIAEEAILVGFAEIDITSEAVARLDARVGDGSALSEAPPAAPPPASNPAEGEIIAPSGEPAVE